MHRLSLRANFSWTFVGNGIHDASWLAMTVILAQWGSPEDVGRFALGLASTAPVFMFATLRLRDIQATDVAGEYRFEDYYALRMATTLAAMLTVVAIAAVSGFRNEMAWIIVAMGLSKSLEAISDAFYGLFMQQERLDWIAKSLMIKGPLSLIGLAAGFYFTGRVLWGAAGIVAARLLVLITYDIGNAAGVLGRVGSKAPGRRRWPRPSWHASTMVRLFRFALPLGFVTLLIALNTNIPRYVIQFQVGTYALGVFAAITAFQKVGPTVVQALGRSAAPRLARYFVERKAPEFRRLTLKVVVIGGALGLAGVGAALVLGRWLLTLLYGPEYAFPGLLALIMVAAAFDYLATMLVFVITAARYFSVQLPLHVATTAGVAVACLVLVPVAGLTGAAWALIIGSAIRMAGAAMAARRVLSRLAEEESQAASTGGLGTPGQAALGAMAGR